MNTKADKESQEWLDNFMKENAKDKELEQLSINDPEMFESNGIKRTKQKIEQRNNKVKIKKEIQETIAEDKRSKARKRATIF